MEPLNDLNTIADLEQVMSALQKILKVYGRPLAGHCYWEVHDAQELLRQAIKRLSAAAREAA
jgi:hypothetical protein